MVSHFRDGETQTPHSVTSLEIPYGPQSPGYMLESPHTSLLSTALLSHIPADYYQIVSRTNLLTSHFPWAMTMAGMW